jgi:hypothetical protein
MGKDIFEDGYFSKHRDDSQWNGLKSKSLSNVLNLKNKPKKKLDEVIPPKKEEKTVEDPQEEILDNEYKEQVKLVSGWKLEFLKSVVAGFCGGIIVLIVLKISLFDAVLWSVEGTVNAIALGIVALIFLIVFGIIYRVIERNV